MHRYLNSFVLIYFFFWFILFFPLHYLTSYMMQPLVFPYSCSSLLTIFFVSLLLVGNHGGARIILPANVTVPAVIVFGDSIMDQGSNNNLNTLVKANFPPYGKDFVNGKPTGRFSNNKTPADMIGKACIFKLFFVT